MVIPNLFFIFAIQKTNMNNSSVCSSKVNGVEKPKVKYKTAEAAFTAAKYLNMKPNLIHVFGEYKCLTCHYFHVGRTKKVKDSNPIYNQKPIERPINPQVEKPKSSEVDLFALINPSLVPIKEIEQPVPEKVIPLEKELVHDDFDWGDNKKEIKSIESYYDKLFK